MIEQINKNGKKAFHFITSPWADTTSDCLFCYCCTIVIISHYLFHILILFLSFFPFYRAEWKSITFWFLLFSFASILVRLCRCSFVFLLHLRLYVKRLSVFEFIDSLWRKLSILSWRIIFFLLCRIWKNIR